MYVADKSGDDTWTQSLHTSFGYSLRRNLNSLPIRLVELNATVMPNVAWLPNPALRKVTADSPDLIHLHWAQNGFVPLSWLRTLGDTPLLWTFHDMWPFCGVLHNEYEDGQRFHKPYTSANYPPERSGFDIDAMVWRQKQKLYADLNVAAVAPSRWLADKARQSVLWKNRRIEVIPNGLDTDIFKPVDRSLARRLFNLPEDKTILLSGAMYARDDINKGYAKLRAALDQLGSAAHDFHFAVFGMDEPSQPENLPYPVSYLGVIKDEISLASLYSAADVMVVPSLQESFGQTASEPMACGRPAVAFNTSGLRDVIDHQRNGYLAHPFDPADLARGILWVLEDPMRWRSLCESARNKALSTFASSAVAQRHLSLYQELLEPQSSPRSASNALLEHC